MPRPSVVFTSGQLMTHECWTPQLAALSRDYDLRFSDHTRDETIGGMAERLLDEAPPRFHLVALAMGGFTAFEVMRRAPERVISLVLISTLAPNDGPAQTERRQGYIRLVEAGRFADVVEERIPILVHPARREDATLLSVVRRMAAETGAETFLRQQRAIMGRADNRPSLGAIACPTLLIHGAQDGITTDAHQAEILAGVPGARLEAIDDCGHLPTLERPATTNRILAAWLASAGG
ncbi:MAG: alpha/beta fold hydrolase [Phenylobacterium sp.]|uniref:alpha/beta fold hydrolase n=1 Tax=Phenylobacterium sp. TaxID=1871053 RepID=UPI001A45E2AF|nr:alpha/beta fold hydrolase [Phenylobacterium sp.]MBL8554857.1 alpha/beta fold hydrolase [Phenylobacterium sp.]